MCESTGYWSWSGQLTGDGFDCGLVSKITNTVREKGLFLAEFGLTKMQSLLPRDETLTPVGTGPQADPSRWQTP